MVEVRMQTRQASVVKQRMQARVDRIRKAQHRPGLRVEPKNEDIRRILKHPSGIRFRSEGSVEWPDDIYTRRRLRDGDIKIVEQKDNKAKTAPPHHHRAESE